MNCEGTMVCRTIRIKGRVGSTKTNTKPRDAKSARLHWIVRKKECPRHQTPPAAFVVKAATQQRSYRTVGSCGRRSALVQPLLVSLAATVVSFSQYCTNWLSIYLSWVITSASVRVPRTVGTHPPEAEIQFPTPPMLTMAVAAEVVETTEVEAVEETRKASSSMWATWITVRPP